MKAMLSKLWISACVMAGALILAVLLARLIPQSPFGGILFQARWYLSFNRGSLLKDYTSHFTGDTPRNLPKNLDTFLCNKFSTGKDPSELNFIADFYVALAGGHEGKCFANIGMKVAENIMRRIDLYDDIPTKRRALLTVEEARIGKQLYKAYLDPPNEKALLSAILLYHRWIDSPPTDWTQKRLLNPIAASGLAWRIP